MTCLNAALDYASLVGLASFPVGPDCRVPRCEHGCKDASKDPAAIRKLWSGNPEFNIAIATGAPSGVFVLDIDRKGEVDGFACLSRLEAANGALPRTWRTATPSGGEHRWFRWSEGIALVNRVGLKSYAADGSVREKFHGLDIRTTGGSVAAPPSRKDTGSYVWLDDPTEVELSNAPAWLMTLIDPPPPPPRKHEPLRITSTERAYRYVRAVVDGECGELAGMGKGSGRNLKLFQASANLGSLVGADLMTESTARDYLETAADICGLLREDGAHAVRATINSGMRRGLSNPREVAL